MATFEEILTAALSEKATKETQEATDTTSRRSSLLEYFTAFVPFLQLVNGYQLKGQAFISGDKTFNNFKNKMEAEIANHDKVTCGWEANLKKDLQLRLRFFNDIERGNFIRIQLRSEMSTKSEDYTDQFEAATYFSKIVAKYKD